MRILVSNDDGVHAKGIKILAAELRNIAEIIVVAPDRNRSGASNSLTVQVPVRVLKLSEDRYSVIGTPTDCVHLALSGLLDEHFDMVVSGINHGSNLADDVIYSGTVAAAMEGRMLGMPAIAVSLVGKEPQVNFITAAVVVRQLIEKLKLNPLPAGTILSVNVPDVPLAELRGMEITRLGKRRAPGQAIKTFDPHGCPLYWVGASGIEEDAEVGTDFHAVNDNKVSVTPLQVDMTDYNAFEKTAQWLVE